MELSAVILWLKIFGGTAIAGQFIVCIIEWKQNKEKNQKHSHGRILKDE